MRIPDEVEVTIEVPRGARVKRGPDGRFEFASPFRCPFNYGSVHAIRAPDGDPLDALVLGDALAAGHVGRWPVVGIVDFVDAGTEDLKVICGAPMTPAHRDLVLGFFTRYGRIKRAANLLRGRRGFTGLRGLHDR